MFLDAKRDLYNSALPLDIIHYVVLELVIMLSQPDAFVVAARFFLHNNDFIACKNVHIYAYSNTISTNESVL